MVCNYSQINNLQQTSMLYNEAANNQSISAEQDNTTLLLFLFSTCLPVLFCVFFTLLFHLVTDLLFNVALNRGRCIVFLPQPLRPAHIWDDKCLQCAGWRGQTASLCLIRNITAPRALFSVRLPHNHWQLSLAPALSHGWGWHKKVETKADTHTTKKSLSWDRVKGLR